MSDASDTAFLCEAENRFGDAGYATWFKILELIAKENGANLTGKIEISEKVLCQKLRKRSLRVEELLNFYQTSTSLLWKRVDQKFIIEVPKLLKLGDNYQKDLQASGKSLASKEEEIRDKSKEEEKNKTPGAKRRGVVRETNESPPKPEPNPHVSDFISFASESFLKTHGQKLVIVGKTDGSNVKRLLGQFDIETLKKCWNYYISTNGKHGSWFTEQGYTITNFCSGSNFAKCLQGSEMPEGIDQKTAANLKHKQLFVARMEAKYGKT